MRHLAHRARGRRSRLPAASPAPACLLKPLAELPVTMTLPTGSPDSRPPSTASPVSFLLDSGAFFSSLSADHAATLNLRLVPMPRAQLRRSASAAFRRSRSQTRVASFGLAGADAARRAEFAVVHSGVTPI